MTLRQLTAPHAVLLEEPQNGIAQTSEMIRGERFRILEERDGWLRAENAFDGHVGWLPPGTAHREPVAPTHRVRALRADLHPGPTHRAPPVATLSFGSLVTLDGRAENGWVGTDDGLWLFAGWLEPVDAAPATDHIATALRFLETPYVWGGRSSFGIDCSGLVLTAMAAAGTVSHHSSGMQRKDERLGEWLSGDGNGVEYRRGDIVFFPGHVGLMVDGTNLLHATVFTMSVVIEPLSEVAERAEVNGVRRPGQGIHRPALTGA
ncbi:NlpC/P60 family protein [Azospirillum sp. A29]|jgi:cell wall-associated NlpC family hydrolase|uniref:C40 family peptidase n=1 Tax=Azospirillum sp. A29 TaxID=3160606 RepID=UPI0036706926